MVKRNPSCNGCEKCGDKLSGQAGCCCTHTCHAICVYLEGGCDDEGYCSCEEIASTYLLYDQETNSYHGSIGCSDLVVDLEFVIKYCKEQEQCVICLISECATTDYEGDLDGQCDNEISCQPLLIQGTEACVGEADGVFLEGGLEHTWDINVANCGDENCSSMQIKTVCTPRIFPKEVTDYDGTGCIGCDCLCSDLCISYFGTECSDGNRVTASDEGVWEFEVAACDSSQDDQNGRTIRIELHKNETTEECELLVTASEYGKDDIEQIIALDQCPEIPFSTIYLNEEQTEYWTFECWKCKGCTNQYCVCECNNADISGPGFLLPDTLNFDFYQFTDPNGGGSGSITLKFRPNEHRSGPCIWDNVIPMTFDGPNGPITIPVKVILEFGRFTPPSYPNLCGWGLRLENLGYWEPFWQEATCYCDPLLLTFHSEFLDSGGRLQTWDAVVSE